MICPLAQVSKPDDGFNAGIFPKTRPLLPPEIARIYTAHYKRNRTGGTPASSLSQKMESWLHRQVAADVRFDTSDKTTLEIGAGTLNQLMHEPTVGPYDIVEPFKELYQGSRLLSRIRNIYSDIREISEHEQYDRITSIATFEHVCNAPEVIAQSGLLLKRKGVLRVSIPSEGTFLWTLGWKLTTGLEFRIKHGLDYGLLIKHEHVNSAKEIENALRYFFLEVHGKVFGLCKSFSLYQFYACANPETVRCREYLAQINSSSA
jgi:2-polyprenyl-3-methyl-5-hydroxy-6-metoxy-1,4-benzoquinol methylase